MYAVLTCNTVIYIYVRTHVRVWYVCEVLTFSTVLLITAVLCNECCAVLCCFTRCTAGGITVYNYEMREDVCRSKFTGGGASLLWAPQQVMEGRGGEGQQE